MAKNTVEINDETFDSEVRNEERAVLVDFWAPWCTPCLMVAPVLEKIAGDLADKLKVCKLNIDDNQKTASEFGVMSIPTMIIFKEGKERDRIIGALGESEITRRIKKQIV